MKSEGPKEAAQRVANRIFTEGLCKSETAAAIEEAIRNDRTRAAKIVNDARTEGHVDLRSLVTLILADD